MTQSTARVSYLQRLLQELDELATDYTTMLSKSGIVNIDPNTPGYGFVFIGFPVWGWAPSDTAGEAMRMTLLRRLRDWMPRFRLLFDHPTPVVEERLKDGLGLLERWLLREGGDHGVPSTIAAAGETLAATVADVRSLADLLPSDEYLVRLAPDTNALIDNPELAAYTGQLGPRYMAHLLPVTLGEIDNLKRAGRTPELRESAARANRRLKGLFMIEGVVGV